MSRNGEGSESLKKYHTEPPQWLSTAHSSADLGFHGFFPPRPDQPEDLLSDSNVKHGYSATHTMGAEHFSSLASIKDRILNHNALSDLNELMNQVLARRAENNAHLPDHVYKPPQRITLSEVRRQSWQTDFFNPDVPLHTIGDKIPHAKGHDLLVLLQDNKVPISRAVWYVRGLGGNEIQGMRNRPNYSPTQYSVEWANVVTGYLKKLLAEVALPSAARLGLNIKQTFKRVLNDPDTRDKWVSKFSYCLDLLREFYAESLVDHAFFLSWLAQQMQSSNLAQAIFVARIVDEYLEGMLPYRSLQRALIDGCLTKLADIQTSTGSEHLTSLNMALQSLLQRIFIYNPDSFVNPKNWLAYSSTITQILRDYPFSVAPNRSEWESAIENDLDDLARRNDALLFRIIPERATVKTKFTMSDVKVYNVARPWFRTQLIISQLLNSFTESTNLSSITILDTTFDDMDSISTKLNMLLTWSITSHQYGDHRPYAVASLLLMWMHRMEDRAIRRGSPSPDEILQDQLFEWIDNSEVAANANNVSAMAVTFGELVSRGIFSYSKYLHRLVARGETGLLINQEPSSRHRPLLKTTPLFDSNTALANQRKVTLYGISCRTPLEEIKEKELRRVLRACLPEIFGGTPLSPNDPIPFQPEVFSSATRYEYIRVLQHWLYPIFERHLKRPVNGGDVISLQAYVTIMYILTFVKAYRLVLEMNLKLLAVVSTPELLDAIVDTIRRYADIWNCMDAHETLIDALCAAQEIWNWTSRRAQSRPLLCLLIEYLEHPAMTPEAKNRINEDATALMQGLVPPSTSGQREPGMLARISMLSQEDDTSLATNIWMRHAFSSTWVQEVWQNTLEALRELQSSYMDAESRKICILRYAQFLWDIDQHLLPSSFDRLVFQWATGPGKNELRQFDAEMWSAITTILLYLVTKDVLMAPNVIKGIVYPILETCTSPHPNRSTMLRFATNIALQLLVQNVDNTSLTSHRLDEIQKLQTRRRTIYADENFSLLVKALPGLVTLEHTANLEEDLRQAVSQLRIAISKDSAFRMVAYRNLDMVSRAFWNSDSQSLQQDCERHLGNALQQILSDSKPWVLQVKSFNWRTLSSFLSPWRYARTAIELQLALRSLGANLRDPELKEAASKDLYEFGSSFFGQPLSSEETDLIADMLRGISGIVACKLINSGLQRITELFNELEDLSSTSAVRSLLHNVGEALHLICSILQPLRADPSGLPNIEPEVQDAFVDTIKSVTQRLEQYTLENDFSNDIADLAVIVARLWQFDLCLPGAWTPRMKDAVPEILVLIIKLAIKYSCGIMANSIVFDVLLDTAFVLFDEIPRDSKALTIDLFQYTPNINHSDLPTDISGLQRRRLASLLSFVPDDTYVQNLRYAWTDASGSLVISNEVQNNPWEWAESIEPPVSTTKLTREKPDLKNNSSIPLELFGTRSTGERVIGELPDTRAREAAAVRQLEDGLASDSMFERDWRDSRVNWKANLVVHSGEGGEDGSGSVAPTGMGSGSQLGIPGSGGSSPSPTVRSHRSSTASTRTQHRHRQQSHRAGSVLSTSSRGRSSVHGDTSFIGSGTTDSVSTSAATGGKRKASPGSSLNEYDTQGVVRGSTTGRRGRPRGSGTGRGKTKKK
ncbi:hypothetical protein Clacol_000785 [Clathrus columnatus]|uniref:Mediator of RNA polymerase II transcription subunit 12 n=1 Tax=Clathrus columnatus TaxID=1419009 RepID=A0AAV4ZZA1_9AGAM|nr:hypothetical protein Clacol_000785 [Clathrus columnatus]